MPVSGKTAAPSEIPYLTSGDIPDMGAGDKAIAERVAAILEAENRQPLSWLKKGTKKQIIVCNAAGVPQYRLMSGDVTIDEEGVAAIGNEKVDAARIKKAAVTATKVAAMPGARVTRSGLSQSIASRGEFKPVLFDAEDWDYEGMHSLAANTSRLTCVTAGVYIIQGLVQFSGPATGGETSAPADGDRVAALVKNGSPAEGPIPGNLLTEASVAGRTSDPLLPGSGGNAIMLSAPCQLSAGDYVEIWVWQNSGETLKILSGDGLHEPFLSAVFQHSL